MLLVDFDPNRRLRLQSLIIFERNSSLNPANDLNSLQSNRLFGFKFDKSKIEIANDFPTYKKRSNKIFLMKSYYMAVFNLLKNGRREFWRNNVLDRSSLRNKIYFRRNIVNKSASIVVTF